MNTTTNWHPTSDHYVRVSVRDGGFREGRPIDNETFPVSLRVVTGTDPDRIMYPGELVVFLERLTTPELENLSNSLLQARNALAVFISRRLKKEEGQDR